MRSPRLPAFPFSIRFTLCGSVAAVLLFFPGVLLNELEAQTPPRVELEIVGGPSAPADSALQVGSGWPLTIRMTTSIDQGMIGIVRPGWIFAPAQFPEMGLPDYGVLEKLGKKPPLVSYYATGGNGGPGYIVFEEPDDDVDDPLYGCLSMGFPQTALTCCETLSSTDCGGSCASLEEGESCVIPDVGDGTCQWRYRYFHPVDSDKDAYYLSFPCEMNETTFEFTADVDLPGVDDGAGRRLYDRGTYHEMEISTYRYSFSSGENLATELILDGDSALKFVVGLCSENINQSVREVVENLEYCETDSDCSLNKTCEDAVSKTDGFRFGSDDDIPGLMILTKTGVGAVLEPVMGATGVVGLVDSLVRRNLAGFINSVAFELSDSEFKTSVTAGMVVPNGLFKPEVLLDDCVEWPGDPSGCTCLVDCTGIEYQIDGGPWTSLEDPGEIYQVLADYPVQIEVFLLAGIAPDTLADENGDNEVNYLDALELGYDLLSDVEVFTIYHEVQDLHCPNFDKDGNGLGSCVAPGGAGRITPPPR